MIARTSHAEIIPAGQPPSPAIMSPINAEALISQAIGANVPIETLERLMVLREKLRAEAAFQAFLEAMAGFQGECPVIVKSSTAKGAKFSYKYAPLDQIITTIQPYLKKWGLCHTIDTLFEDGPQPYQVAVCTVHHVGGHSQTSTFRAPIDRDASMNDMQKNASAQTYAKRYALVNAYGIVTGEEDDDGHGAGARPEPRQSAPAPQQHQSPQRQSETRQQAPAPSQPRAAALVQQEPTGNQIDWTRPHIKGLVEKWAVKEGVGSKGAWKRVGVRVNGDWYNTFDTEIGETLREAWAGQYSVMLFWEKDKNGYLNALEVIVA